jgi:hypothetical protein
MKKNYYNKILVTKLSESVHKQIKAFAEKERRTLSNMSRVIIEDFLKNQEKREYTN